MIQECISTGRKWAISTEQFEQLSEYMGQGYYVIHLPSLDIHANRIGDTAHYVCQGVGGYIGLSHGHSDGWHIGTPAFALSLPLIRAMEKLT